MPRDNELAEVVVDVKAELGKTAAIIAEVRANLNASIEREKGAERRAAEAQKDARKVRAEFDALRADHERETNTLVAGHERAEREKDAEVKNLRDKAEDASARASAAEGRLGAVNEELERVRRELDRRAGDIKRHEAEIERRRKLWDLRSRGEVLEALLGWMTEQRE